MWTAKCPGLTSPGATMDNVEAETVCGIYAGYDLKDAHIIDNKLIAEDKEHALAIGVTTMATTEIRDVNKGLPWLLHGDMLLNYDVCCAGIGVETLHFLGDGLWLAPTLD